MGLLITASCRAHVARFQLVTLVGGLARKCIAQGSAHHISRVGLPPQRTITVETVELCFQLQIVAVLADDSSAVAPSTSCSRKIHDLCCAEP
jgi:hypothetical protein